MYPPSPNDAPHVCEEASEPRVMENKKHARAHKCSDPILQGGGAAGCTVADQTHLNVALAPPGRCLCWEYKLRWSTLKNRCTLQSQRRWGRSGAPAKRNDARACDHTRAKAIRVHSCLNLHDGVLALDVVDCLQPARACSFGAAVNTAGFALKRNVRTELHDACSLSKRSLAHAPQMSQSR